MFGGPSFIFMIYESFNGSLRDEMLNGEIFHNLAEAKVLIEARRRHYYTIRPLSSLGYRPPAPETATPPVQLSGSASLHLQAALAPEMIMYSRMRRAIYELVRQEETELAG